MIKAFFFAEAIGQILVDRHLIENCNQKGTAISVLMQLNSIC